MNWEEGVGVKKKKIVEGEGKEGRKGVRKRQGREGGVDRGRGGMEKKVGIVRRVRVKEREEMGSSRERERRWME